MTVAALATQQDYTIYVTEYCEQIESAIAGGLYTVIDEIKNIHGEVPIEILDKKANGDHILEVDLGCDDTFEVTLRPVTVL